MNITKVSVRHSLQALVGVALVVLPVTIKVLKNWPRASDAVQVLGAVTVLLTDPRAVFFVKTVLDIFLPEEGSQKVTDPAQPERTTIASRFRQAIGRPPKNSQ